MTLFSIVGVQAFQGSFRRACQWTGTFIGSCAEGSLLIALRSADPTGVFENVTFDQRCGGFIDSVTGNATGYIVSATGLPTNEAAKGFICPSPSICIVNRFLPPANARLTALTLAGGRESQQRPHELRQHLCGAAPGRHCYFWYFLRSSRLQFKADTTEPAANTWTGVMFNMM